MPSKRKRTSILSILLVLNCALAITKSNAQENDPIHALGRGDLARVIALFAAMANVNINERAYGDCASAARPQLRCEHYAAR
jgi:hypothetical protein